MTPLVESFLPSGALVLTELFYVADYMPPLLRRCERSVPPSATVVCGAVPLYRYMKGGGLRLSKSTMILLTGS